MPKVWLAARWEMLLPLLENLTVDQEDEIARLCQQEIAYWRARPTMKSLSSLKEPMSDTRKKIMELPLTEHNSYLNPRTRVQEHIALKHMNYSEAEWAEMNKQSDEKFHARLENQQLLDHPDRIVARAGELLSSKNWADVVVGLAVLTGRRLAEILKTGELYPKTLHSALFSGQLKRKDKVLKPYEIPVLVEANRVLAAWSGLRKMTDCSQKETEMIGKAMSTEVGEVAARHFSDLVPVREGREKLFSHLFRAVYPRLAVFYFCPTNVSDIVYVSAILGHYWSTSSNEEQQYNYVSSLHYFDYKIGDGAGNIDGRQGIRLGEPGVKVLEVFKPKPAAVADPQKEAKTELLELEKKKTHSLTRIAQETRSRIDQVQKDLGYRTQDETLSHIIDEHYILSQIVSLLKPLYEQLGADTPLGAIQSLLGEGSTVQVDRQLGEYFQTSLTEIINLLADTAEDSKEKRPTEYLRELLQSKRQFKRSYGKRHAGKDYSKLSLTTLRRTKMPGAAEERFRRAVDAIIKNNETVDQLEFRRFINPAVVVDLVGGRPSDAKDYITKRRAEIDAHHKKYGITVGYNRGPVPITQRIQVPEWPEGIESEQEIIETEGE